MKKKLTNTKGFPTVMMIFAFLFSACAVVQEFVMQFAYKKLFTSGELVNYVLLDNKGYIEVYGTAVTMFVLAFLTMIVVISGSGRRTTGTREGAILLVTGISTAVVPTYQTIKYVIDGNLNNTKSDGELFRAVNRVVAYGLPAFVSLLILLAGLGILIKAGASKTVVEVFKNAPKSVSGLAMPQEMPTPAQEIPQPVVEPVMDEVVVPAMAEVEEEIPQPAEVEAIIEDVKQEQVLPIIDEVAEEKPSGVCKNCGLENNAGAKFCRNCGSPLN